MILGAQVDKCDFLRRLIYMPPSYSISDNYVPDMRQAQPEEERRILQEQGNEGREEKVIFLVFL
jgi:hypothetical protein